ncbi:flagellar protein FhlB-like protein [Thermoanaerobacter mathranii subsp. mathranii str. A3]|uniref:Flagellar biosynthesis protein n=2 Tax=Thermoanaerobacter TaxID=1754 RepID=A0ABT9M3P2_9THEO|nr:MULTISPECIES: EscU/YscU/HrcU family type III secretion system export apparatus switch protein [Thermoanaerobacter]ADH61141.1 flagellar protein FhlB-like protein [Thermoanaerobacter mathranii subsp. mathranii str. A3]MDP9750749.1 flagellar biosynthesis protein [Thermoanaerobacter pentosaceus]
MGGKRRKKAVALKYDVQDIAPKVIAKGQGFIADKILEKAQQQKLPIYKDEEVVEKLYNLEIQQYIPEDLYNIVAEILIFIGYLDKIAKNETNG